MPHAISRASLGPRPGTAQSRHLSRQVHRFLKKVFFKWKLPVPKVLAYDDACHLLRFLRNRAGERKHQYGYSDFAWWLLHYKKVKLVVDRFHFKNHKALFCKRYARSSAHN